MNKSKVKNKKLKVIGGFTILESIVAIFILSLSISGAFSAVQQGLSQSIIAKDEVKAFYLAQEAIEIIRNKRDTNQLYKMANPSTPNTWLYGIAQDSGDPCYFGTGPNDIKICKVDATAANPLTYCNSNIWGNCDYLKQTTDTFLYNYTSGNVTNFKREIQIEKINDNEIAVSVRVSWKKGSLPEFVFKAKTLLFNWI